LEKLNYVPESVLELGCFDGKTIHFLPDTIQRYVGFDADFEGGLTLAKKIWRRSKFDFNYCTRPEDMKVNEMFDIAICMETFELINDELLDGYVTRIAQATKGYFFVTTSNQKGIGFASKHIIKKILGYSVPHYSLKEFFFATIGRVDKIKRSFRKGWDHQTILKIIKKHFEIIEVSRYPYNFLPGFGICIIAKKKEEPLI